MAENKQAGQDLGSFCGMVRSGEVQYWGSHASRLKEVGRTVQCVSEPSEARSMH